MAPASLEQVVAAFQRHDADKTGLLDCDALKGLLHRLAPNIPESALKTTICESSTSASEGQVRYEDFLKWIFEPDARGEGNVASNERQLFGSTEVFCFTGAVATRHPVEEKDTIGSLRERISAKVGVRVDRAILINCRVLGEEALHCSVGDMDLFNDDDKTVSSLTSAKDGRCVFLCCPRTMSSRNPCVGPHKVVVDRLRADSICVDWDSAQLFYANRAAKQIKVLDLHTKTSTLVAQLEHSPTALAMAHGQLFVLSSGTEAGYFRDGMILGIHPNTGETKILAQKLFHPNALAVSPDGKVFFTEGSASDPGSDALGVLIFDGVVGTSRRIRDLPFTPSGGLVVLDAVGESFAIGTHRSSPSSSGQVYIMLADGPPLLAMSGIAANESLALDAEGCLYSSGSCEELPGIDAFPGFQSSALLALKASPPANASFPIALLHLCIDEKMMLKRNRSNVMAWQLVKGLAVNPQGDTIFYSTVRESLKIGVIHS